MIVFNIQTTFFADRKKKAVFAPKSVLIVATIQEITVREYFFGLGREYILLLGFRNSRVVNFADNMTRWWNTKK